MDKYIMWIYTYVYAYIYTRIYYLYVLIVYLQQLTPTSYIYLHPTLFQLLLQLKEIGDYKINICF